MYERALWLTASLPRPQVIFTVASVMAAVALGSSLLLLWAALDSHNPTGLFAKMGLPGMHYGQITCMVYLKVSLVSLSDFLTLFSSRTPRFFWTQRPGWLLMGAATVVSGCTLCSAPHLPSPCRP
jgi:H+-transporting ATPase